MNEINKLASLNLHNLSQKEEIISALSVIEGVSKKEKEEMDKEGEVAVPEMSSRLKIRDMMAELNSFRSEEKHSEDKEREGERYIFDSNDEYIDNQDQDDVEPYTFDPMKRSQEKHLSTQIEQLNASLKDLEEHENENENERSAKGSDYMNISALTGSSDLQMNVYQVLKEMKDKIFLKMGDINNFCDNINLFFHKKNDYSKGNIHFNASQLHENIYDQCFEFLNKTKRDITNVIDTTENELTKIKKNKKFFDTKLKEMENSLIQLTQAKESQNELSAISRNDNKAYEHDIIESTHIKPGYDDLLANRKNDLSKLIKKVLPQKTKTSCSIFVEDNQAKTSYHLNPEVAQHVYLKKSYINNLTKLYRDKLDCSQNKNGILNDKIRFYENLIVSSKTLIDELYVKNQLLTQKLVKYRSKIKEKYPRI